MGEEARCRRGRTIHSRGRALRRRQVESSGHAGSAGDAPGERRAAASAARARGRDQGLAGAGQRGDVGSHPAAAGRLVRHASGRGSGRECPSLSTTYGRLAEEHRHGAPVSDADRAQLDKERTQDDSTIDNDATITQIRVLARVYVATRDARFKKALDAGVDYLLRAQYKNGGWPQYFPLRKDYSRHITFNDNAIVNVLTLFSEIRDKRAAVRRVRRPHPGTFGAGGQHGAADHPPHATAPRWKADRLVPAVRRGDAGGCQGAHVRASVRQRP